MLLLLTLPVVFIVARVYAYLQLYAPSNVLIARVRAAPPCWRYVPILAALAAATLIAMHRLAEAVAVGAPGWLNLVALVLAWDSIKFGVLTVFQVLRAVCATTRATLRRTCVRQRAALAGSPMTHRVSP